MQISGVKREQCRNRGVLEAQESSSSIIERMKEEKSSPSLGLSLCNNSNNNRSEMIDSQESTTEIETMLSLSLSSFSPKKQAESCIEKHTIYTTQMEKMG